MADEKIKAPAKTSSTKKAVEEIAAARGMLPQYTQAPARIIGSRVYMNTLKLNPEFWKFAAAKAYAGWNTGAEISESEFDDVIHSATNARIG